MNIPERYEDVTAEWLTQALRAGGIMGDQTVIEFQIDPLGAGRSRASSLARIAVEYDGHSQNLPGSMLAKFVSRIQRNRDLYAGFGIFQREIALYENLGDAIPLNMPKMYFGQVSNDSDLAAILLEEISAISKDTLPPERRSLTADEARLALRDVSKMHAKWWGDQNLDAFKWLTRADNDWRKSLYQKYDGAWTSLRDVLKPALKPVEVRICDNLSGHLPTLMSELDKMPVTLIHGDFHTGNLMWDRPGQPDAVWVIDWQTPGAGPPVVDVARFLGSAFRRSDLPSVRQDYLPAYHDSLVSHGVADYSYERLLSDYRFGLLDRLALLISGLANLDFGQEDFVDYARTQLANIAAAAVDAGCSELIA
ncbi:MAG: phosphotransferase [SAR202 cluster bacterium]|nr:phosphotransferase [SAR202 cluster bacterium]